MQKFISFLDNVLILKKCKGYYKLQVLQKLKGMIWKSDKIPLPVIGVTCNENIYWVIAIFVAINVFVLHPLLNPVGQGFIFF